MRPLRLDLAGFTVFREPTTIDFTDTDFFALVGPTGSGKSTVLDAICFALYGTVPRWGDRRAIANALAPSTAEARVRLAFESGGVRYILTRVVRRDTRGAVSTKQAGLEALPAGFDLSHLDAGLSTEDLGAVLAGTPSEVDEAVADVVGLPYEQFTKCVVLPQGEFAAFLHAKPAERQKILVNLLGLEVYGRIRERANGIAGEAEAQLKATDGHLTSYGDATPEALEEAAGRVDVARTLAAEVDAARPALAHAQRTAGAAVEALAALDAELTRLTAVRRPSDVDSLAAAAVAARLATAQAGAVLTETEEREEKLRAELADGGDPTALRRLLDAHRLRASLQAERDSLASVLDGAQREHDAAQSAVDAARAEATAAAGDLEAAREAYQTALALDRAAELRPHLVEGEPCPVCTQPVATLPPMPESEAAVAAKEAGVVARRRSDAAAKRLAERDTALRALDRNVAAARAKADDVAVRLSTVDGQLDGAPAPKAIERTLSTLDRLRQECEKAGTAVRKARETARATQRKAESAEHAVRDAWRAFDTARDAVAPFGPPPADRDDLSVAWTVLATWASAQADDRRGARAVRQSEVHAGEAAVVAARDRLRALFQASGVPGPTGLGGDDFARAAAVAVERADAAHRRLTERLTEAARLRERRAGYERDAQVAKTLAGHLRADRFERWLLSEALDALVEGASGILRELSGGQYDLGHDKGEFFVVDHHDAGLRRAVRTLSGGETFQASLALALALSEQLAGMSTGTASLESIVLDEGFGTLDAATLDTVAATLENLAARGDRMVGVVTHVGALAERIPTRFEVSRDARTARVERVSL
jgi:exonuclease SbcC